jgi:hypothetical protein
MVSRGVTLLSSGKVFPEIRLATQRNPEQTYLKVHKF